MSSPYLGGETFSEYLAGGTHSAIRTEHFIRESGRASMPAKKVKMQVAHPVEIGNVDVEFEVRDGNALMGRRVPPVVARCQP